MSVLCDMKHKIRAPASTFLQEIHFTQGLRQNDLTCLIYLYYYANQEIFLKSTIIDKIEKAPARFNVKKVNLGQGLPGGGGE